MYTSVKEFGGIYFFLLSKFLVVEWLSYMVRYIFNYAAQQIITVASNSTHLLPQTFVSQKSGTA